MFNRQFFNHPNNKNNSRYFISDYSSSLVSITKKTHTIVSNYTLNKWLLDLGRYMNVGPVFKELTLIAVDTQDTITAATHSVDQGSHSLLHDNVNPFTCASANIPEAYRIAADSTAS